MATKIFEINAEWEDGQYGATIQWDGKIEIDQRILDAVDDDWRSQLYSLNTEQEIAEHIARNFVINGIDRVQELEGWANQPSDVICQIVL